MQRGECAVCECVCEREIIFDPVVIEARARVCAAAESLWQSVEDSRIPDVCRVLWCRAVKRGGLHWATCRVDRREKSDSIVLVSWVHSSPSRWHSRYPCDPSDGIINFQKTSSVGIIIIRGMRKSTPQGKQQSLSLSLSVFFHYTIKNIIHSARGYWEVCVEKIALTTIK